jgi:hypothetical protein
VRPRRVDVGFAGGQILSLRMRDEAYAALRQALEEASARWHEVATEDSRVVVDLAQVVYVRLDTEQRGVGFSTP